ncbi:MAG: M20/M25/M40 family metallo-hydrolase [Actinomycetota bacterium]
METDDRRTSDTVELLQTMIRNQCVNDGDPDSGGEERNAASLRDFLEGAGVEQESFDSRPGRRSVVARLEGTDPEAPSLCLLGHTDVVPVSPDGWSRDPFGGELVGDEVWGRGAVDMLNLTSSMAVAFRHLATDGPRLRGDLLFIGVADEEAGGTWGAEYLLDQHREASYADYVLTEFGGVPTHTAAGFELTLSVAEKGLAWRRLRVGGTPGHGSMPWETDNALVTAAEVVRRLAEYRPRAVIHDLWRRQVAGLELSDEQRGRLLDPDAAWDALAELPPDRARHLHACSHTTFSPNVAHGGVKTNVIPDEVVIELDVRTLPGETAEDVDRHLADALGPLRSRVEVEILQQDDSTASPIDTPLWASLEKAMHAVYPEATLLPSIVVGGTDARIYRHAGSIAYGAGLLSRSVTWEEFSTRFHGHDERIDVESLALSTQLWVDVATDLLG